MQSSMFGRMVVTGFSMACLAAMVVAVFSPLSGVSFVQLDFRQACVDGPIRTILFVVERARLQFIISEGVVPMLRGALCWFSSTASRRCVWIFDFKRHLGGFGIEGGPTKYHSVRCFFFGERSTTRSALGC